MSFVVKNLIKYYYTTNLLAMCNLNEEYIQEIENFYLIKNILTDFFNEVKHTTLEYKKAYVINNIVEDYIEELICKFFNKEELFSYIKHPFGSQKKPDFIININHKFYKEIKLECKSSKTNKPMWNCSLPESDIIYIFYSFHKKYNKFVIFNGSSLMSKNEYKCLTEFAEAIKNKCSEFNNKYKLNFSFYCRNMFNQHVDIDFSTKNNDVLQSIYSL